MRTSTIVISLLSVLVSLVATPDSEVRGALSAHRGLTFENEEARRIFEGYVEFLGADPERFERHLATIRQLQASEIRYHLMVTGETMDGIEGRVTSDGRSVFIHLTHVGGPNGEVASMMRGWLMSSSARGRSTTERLPSPEIPHPVAGDRSSPRMTLATPSKRGRHNSRLR